MPDQLKQHVCIPYAEFLRLSTDDMHVVGEWVKAHDPRPRHRGRIETIEWDVDGDVVVVTIAMPTPERGAPVERSGPDPRQVVVASPPAISPEAVAAFTIENVR